MRFTPVSDDEVARRKALGAASWARKSFPPLYRESSMDPETVLHGTFGESSPVMTYSIFDGDGDGGGGAGLPRPRVEVHTVVRGAIEVAAPLLFHGAVTETPGQMEPVAVTVSGLSASGSLLVATGERWMVSVEAPDATLLVIGSGEVPSPLSLEPVDLRALKRSEFRNSGVVET